MNVVEVATTSIGDVYTCVVPTFAPTEERQQGEQGEIENRRRDDRRRNNGRRRYDAD
jgi:hypothetical protein